MACGAAQVLQAMTNGSAARAGLGAIWVGAISATVSVAALSLTALLFFRLPFPHAGVLSTQGPKVVLGGPIGGLQPCRLDLGRSEARPNPNFSRLFCRDPRHFGDHRQPRPSRNGREAAGCSSICRDPAGRPWAPGRAFMSRTGARKTWPHPPRFLVAGQDILTYSKTSQYYMDKSLLRLNDN
jgi:hypothetical protein